jgi:hypothetical protein
VRAVSHWSQENAKLILNRLCEHPSVTAAGKLLGIPEGSKTVWTWARNSARDKAQGIDESKYIITGWPDDAEDTRPMYFFEALELSRKIFTLNLHAEWYDAACDSVDENWPHIRKLALALQLRGRMTQEEVWDLLTQPETQVSPSRMRTGVKPTLDMAA